MKKIIFFLLIFLPFNFALMAQSKPVQMQKQVTSFFSKYESFNRYHYSSQKSTKGVADTVTIVDSSLYSLNVYGYDSIGKEIQDDLYYYYEYDSGQTTEDGPYVTYTYYNADSTISAEVTIYTLTGDTTEYVEYTYTNQDIELNYSYYGGAYTMQALFYGIKEKTPLTVEELFDPSYEGIPMYYCDSFLIVSQYYDGDSMITESYSGYYTFNADNNPTLLSIPVNYEGMDVTVKYEFTYDVNKNRIQIDGYAVPALLPINIDFMLTTYTYNNALLTEIYTQPVENGYGVEITEEQKTKYYYDVNDNVTVKFYYTLDYEDSLLVLSSKDYLVYKIMQIGGVNTYVVDSVYNYEFSYNEIIDTTGIVTYRLKSLSVYPNPVNDRLVIKGIENDAIVTFYDLVGKQVFRTTVNGNDAFINIQTMDPGMYMIKIQNNQGVYVSKILKR